MLTFSLKGSLNGFLKAYIAKFRYGTVTTEQWKQFLLEFFQKEVISYHNLPAQPNLSTNIVPYCTYTSLLSSTFHVLFIRLRGDIL